MWFLQTNWLSDCMRIHLQWASSEQRATGGCAYARKTISISYCHPPHASNRTPIVVRLSPLGQGGLLPTFQVLPLVRIFAFLLRRDRTFTFMNIRREENKGPFVP